MKSNFYKMSSKRVTPWIEQEMGRRMAIDARKEQGGRKTPWSKLHKNKGNTTPRSPYLMALHANAPTRNKVIRAMKGRKITIMALSEKTGISYHSVKSAMDNMMRIELAEKLGKVDRHFVYRLTDRGRQFIKDLDQKGC